MQTSDEKIGFDIACPQCKHRFTLIEQGAAEPRSSVSSDSSPAATEETRQWVGDPVEEQAASVTPKTLPQVVDSIPSSNAIPPIYQGQAAGSYSCPYCQTRQPPIWKSEVSTAGWITCVLLLVTTCVFFWVGFLIRDKYTVCSSCNVRQPRAFL
jgi:uncharacterized Zn finger protein (UPF0148 family)